LFSEGCSTINFGFQIFFSESVINGYQVSIYLWISIFICRMYMYYFMLPLICHLQFTELQMVKQHPALGTAEMFTRLQYTVTIAVNQGVSSSTISC
jgi:hypothetical protein